MVIAYCHPDRVGGTEWQARLLSRTLARRGHEVVLFALNPGNEQPARETLDGIRIVRIPSLMIRGRLRGGGLGSPILLWRYAAAILAEEPPFDVLHSHLAAHPTAGAALAAGRRRTPLLLKLACSGPQGDLASLRALSLRAYGPLVRRLVSRADRIVAMTEDLESEAVGFGFTPEAITRIPNGVELPDLTAGGASAPGTIVAVGRLDVQKRFDLLIRGVARLVPDFPAVRALIYGEGPLRKELEALAAGCGAGAAVRFMGRQPPERIYPAGNLFVLASDEEGMSNALLEAMSWAKPCVVSGIAANRETVGDAARVFLRGDSAGLAAALAHLLVNLDEARDLGRRARARAAGAFAIERVADRYETLYASMVSGASGASSGGPP